MIIEDFMLYSQHHYELFGLQNTYKHFLTVPKIHILVVRLLLHSYVKWMPVTTRNNSIISKIFKVTGYIWHCPLFHCLVIPKRSVGMHIWLYLSDPDILTWRNNVLSRLHS